MSGARRGGTGTRARRARARARLSRKAGPAGSRGTAPPGRVPLAGTRIGPSGRTLALTLLNRTGHRKGEAVSDSALAAAHDVPTFGVEEEFLLVDRVSRAPADTAPRVIDTARMSLGDQVTCELFTSQLELRTRPAATLGGLRADLARLRAEAGAAAARDGCLLVASGTVVVPGRRAARITDRPRYRRVAAHVGAVARGSQAVLNGCHVHVGMRDRGEALGLSNHLRPWLPVLQAMAANSPFCGGRDTGYGSWRAIAWSRWPTVGPAPVLDPAQYEHLATALVASGLILDRKMIYWYSRPSEHLPTLEIRVADTNCDLDTTVLLAALVRGLAVSMLPAVRDGKPADEVHPELLKAAHWKAARGGLEGVGLDPATGDESAVWRLVDRMAERARPGLAASGDAAAVHALLDRLRSRGGGAARQRAVFRERGRLRDVVDELARDTASPDAAG